MGPVLLFLLLAAPPERREAVTTEAPSKENATEIAVVVDEAKHQFVADFLSDARGKLAGPAAVESLRTPLRALLGRIDEWLAVRVPDVKSRQTVRVALRESLITDLTAELEKAPAVAGSPAPGERGRKLVGDAALAERQRRQDRLFEGIMCWCPKEDWTRTLAGCPDDCANDQKELVRAWLDEGRSDAEILGSMAAHERGGPRVLAVPPLEGTNLLGYVLPFALLAAAVVVVLVLLRRLGRRGPAPGGVRREPDETPEEAEWGDKIEKELKEMES